MRVKTSWIISRPLEEVFHSLYDSRMEVKPGIFTFSLFTLRPVQCRVPTGEAGVGQTRECISDRGVIYQRITSYTPYEHFSFVMEETTLPVVKCTISSIEEDFVLREVEAVEITRTTHIALQPGWRRIFSPLVYLGIKSVHRYVFRNWE